MTAVNDLPSLAMESTAPFTFARRGFGRPPTSPSVRSH
jgi:hypothetical protein